MDMELFNSVLAVATVLVLVVNGLVELVKRSFKPPKKFQPVIALVLGLLIGYLFAPFTDLTLQTRLWAGLLAGLSAAGLYKLGKNVVKK